MDIKKKYYQYFCRYSFDANR